MIQLGQAKRPDELRDLAECALIRVEIWNDHTGFDRWQREAMDRHYELTALPGFCEALARRDWDAIDRIAERWDY